MEGREEGGRSASLRERCTAPFKGAGARFLYGRHCRLPTPPSLAGARRPPVRTELPPTPLPEEAELAGQRVFTALKVQAPTWGPRAHFVNAEDMGAGSCRP